VIAFKCRLKNIVQNMRSLHISGFSRHWSLSGKPWTDCILLYW